MPWIYDPQSGGIKISPRQHQEIERQITSFEQTRPWYPKIRLKTHISGQFCYILTIEDNNKKPMPLCRLRHFVLERWSLAIFTYSEERYAPVNLSCGKDQGTIDEALKTAEPFIV